jgi:hypothetical protein
MYLEELWITLGSSLEPAANYWEDDVFHAVDTPDIVELVLTRQQRLPEAVCTVREHVPARVGETSSVDIPPGHLAQRRLQLPPAEHRRSGDCQRHAGEGERNR